MEPSQWVAVGFGAAGLFLLLVGSFIGRSGWRAVEGRRSWPVADAVVTGVSSRGDGDTWAPRVRFTTREGRVVDGEPWLSSSMSASGTGKPVRVSYDPVDPSRVVVHQASLDGRMHVGCGGFVALLGAGVLLLLLLIAVSAP